MAQTSGSPPIRPTTGAPTLGTATGAPTLGTATGAPTLGTATGAPTLGDVGEFALIAEIAAVSARTGDPEVTLGPGDDAAALRYDGDLLTSVDVLVQGVHFRTDWSAAADVGRKAVAVNVADIEAMGGRARHLLLGFSAPADTPVAWVRELVAGLASECAAAGVAVVGGDTTGGPVISLAVTVLGHTVDGRPPVTRSGAVPGQVVAVCGRLGWAGAGLTALRRGFRSPGQVVRAHRVPEVPYGQGRVAAAAGATAMIDVSDGLLADLGHVAAASGVRIDLDPAAFTIADPVVVVAQATRTDALGLVLTGGEDHALAATFAPADVPAGWQVVGRVLADESDEGPAGASAAGSDPVEPPEPVPDSRILVGGAPWEDPGGYQHFR